MRNSNSDGISSVIAQFGVEAISDTPTMGLASR